MIVTAIAKGVLMDWVFVSFLVVTAVVMGKIFWMFKS